MTAYAISLISDRKLLIKIDFPCKIENFLLPNKIDWVYYNKSIDLKKVTHYTLDVNWNIRLADRKFIKINFLDYKKDKEVIFFKCGLNLIKHLTVNKIHHDKIKQLGFDVKKFNIETLFNKWWRHLFVLKNNLYSNYKSIIKDIRSNSSTKLICAQLRLGVEGDATLIVKSEIKNFWKFIRKEFISNNLDYKIFLTTDTNKVFDEGLLEFGNEKIIGSRDNSVHIDKIGFLSNEMCEKLGGGIIDFLLLGNCDMGVISHSGFGIFGVMNRKNHSELNQFYVYTNPKNLEKRYFKRKNLFFYKFNTSLLYLEFINK